MIITYLQIYLFTISFAWKMGGKFVETYYSGTAVNLGKFVTSVEEFKALDMTGVTRVTIAPSLLDQFLKEIKPNVNDVLWYHFPSAFYIHTRDGYQISLDLLNLDPSQRLDDYAAIVKTHYPHLVDFTSVGPNYALLDITKEERIFYNDLGLFREDGTPVAQSSMTLYDTRKGSVEKKLQGVNVEYKDRFWGKPYQDIQDPKEREMLVKVCSFYEVDERSCGGEAAHLVFFRTSELLFTGPTFPGVVRKLTGKSLEDDKVPESIRSAWERERDATFPMFRASEIVELSKFLSTIETQELPYDKVEAEYMYTVVLKHLT